MLKAIRFVLIATCWFLPVGAAVAESGLQTFDQDRLVIESRNGLQHEFEVELALSWKQQAQGLMFRRELGIQQGMLFVYEREDYRAMWMKNTFIPLDMVFIDAKGAIVGIVEREIPHSLETISVERPVLAVHGLNGGTVSRLGLQLGDWVRHSAFKRES